MAVTVMVMGAADGETLTPHDGKYVAAWNPHVEYGTLAITSTLDRRLAKRFPDGGTALLEWNTVSKVQPTRPDGKENRPLTAVHILVENADEERHQTVQ